MLLSLFKKRDPISERKRQLNSRIQDLENQIRALSGELEGKPRIRSTALPGTTPKAEIAALATPHDNIDFDQKRLGPAAIREAHFNEFGGRKFDFADVWNRFLDYLRGPGAANPRLVKYLMAGSIKGLRPLRYEKRVARNRFLLLFCIFVILLWGFIAVVSSR